MSKLQLHLIRGLPGAGKSTYAKNVVFYLNKDFGCHIAEADNFFTTTVKYGKKPAEIKYKFDANFLHEAHMMCKMETIVTLYHGYDVVVANTFTTMKELQPYLDLADRFPNLEIIIHELHTQYGSIHNVPEATIERMKARWEEVPESKLYKIIKIGA